MSNILSKRKTILMRKSDHHRDFLLDRGSRFETPSPCHEAVAPKTNQNKRPFIVLTLSFGMTVHTLSMQYTYISKEAFHRSPRSDTIAAPLHISPDNLYTHLERCVHLRIPLEGHYRIVTGGTLGGDLFNKFRVSLASLQGYFTRYVPVHVYI